MSLLSFPPSLSLLLSLIIPPPFPSPFLPSLTCSLSAPPSMGSIYSPTQRACQSIAEYGSTDIICHICAHTLASVTDGVCSVFEQCIMKEQRIRMPRPVSALCASPNDSVLALGFKEVRGGGEGDRQERMCVCLPGSGDVHCVSLRVCVCACGRGWAHVRAQ